jgi:hypothetical protein
MTATASAPAATLDTGAAADPLPLVLEAVRCMGRAQDRVGTRMCAYDLLDVAAAIEGVLPLLRAALRACFGEVPMPLRAELAALSRGATNADEFGRALSSIVPSDAPSPGSLAMHLDEWKRAATNLVLELECAGG